MNASVPVCRSSASSKRAMDHGGRTPPSRRPPPSITIASNGAVAKFVPREWRSDALDVDVEQVRPTGGEGSGHCGSDLVERGNILSVAAEALHDDVVPCRPKFAAGCVRWPLKLPFQSPA